MGLEFLKDFKNSIGSRWFRIYRGTEDQKNVVVAYRETMLKTQEDRTVLANMLIEDGFFRESRNEEDVVLSNRARRLLRDLGIWTPENAEAIVNALAHIKEQNDGYGD